MKYQTPPAAGFPRLPNATCAPEGGSSLFAPSFSLRVYPCVGHRQEKSPWQRWGPGDAIPVLSAPSLSPEIAGPGTGSVSGCCTPPD